MLMVTYSGSSGIGYYSCQLCRELSNKGVDVTLLTNQSYHLDAVSKNFRILKLFSRTRKFFFEIPRFMNYIAKESFDIIHFQSYIKFPEIDYLLWKHLKKHNVLLHTIHDVLPHEQRFYDPLLFKRIYRIFDGLIVHSQSSLVRLTEEFNIDKGKLFTIPHGNYDIYKVDQNLSQGLAKSRLSLEKDSKIILFFGHIAKRKGIESLLKVFSDICEENKKVQLVIAGSCSPIDKRHYLSLIEEANKRGRIIHNLEYIPFENVQNYFMAADFVVLPYVEGSTSGVLKLAYAFDRPVITTNVGDLADMVVEGETGFIIPVVDEKVLKEKMSILLNDRMTLKKLADGICIYKLKFGWSSIANKTVDVYDNILKI